MPSRRLTRQDKRRANRARILQAAHKVFAQHGYHGATIGEIADQAGLSNGAVYYNFANKEDLFLALLGEWRTELIRDVETAVGRPGSAGPGHSFQDEMRHVIETLKRGREWRLLLFEFVTYAARNPEFRERFAAGRQDFKAALASALADRIAAHRLQPVASPGQLAVLVAALVNGLAVDELSEPGGIPDDLLATALLALIDPGRQPDQPSATQPLAVPHHLGEAGHDILHTTPVDAVLCAYLAAAVPAGPLGTTPLGWWWLDPAIRAWASPPGDLGRRRIRDAHARQARQVSAGVEACAESVSETRPSPG